MNVFKNTVFILLRSQKAFTLIELLITISIITVLTAIAISTFTSLQKSARDAQRKADLSTIQSALEQYHADQNNYPITGNVGIGTSALTNPNKSRTYLQKIPKESVSSMNYNYEALPNSTPYGCDNTSGKICTKYCLYSQVDNASNISNLSVCADKPGYNYEVTAP